MDLLRCSLVLVAALALGCGNDSGSDTDTDTDAGTFPTSPSSTQGDDDPFDPPDTFPDTFDDDDDPSDDSSTPTFTDSDPTDDPSNPTWTATNTDSESESDTNTASDTATDTDTDTDGDTDGSTDTDDPTDTADPTDPTGDLPDGGACCDAQKGAPGCEEESITSCVCDQDPFCCENEWDDACVVGVVIYGCGTCEGVGGDGDCCAANDTPGCDDDMIEACVCEVDSVCCLEGWDETCAMGVEFENCGRCPPA